MSFSSRDSSSSGLKSGIGSDAPPTSAVPALVYGGGSGGSSIPPLPRVGVRRSSEGIQVPADGSGGCLVRCEICGAVFTSTKGLFGHIKVHTNRGWKGARPPPAFDYLAEFAEYQHLLVKPHDQQEVEYEVAGGGGATATEPPQAAAPAVKAEEYLLPDLNLPPTGLP